MAKFSSKDKIQAVKRYLEGTEGGKTIANSIRVYPRELYQWIKRFKINDNIHLPLLIIYLYL